MSLFLPLDVEYASDEEFIEAGPMAELLFIRAACFIKRKRLDGVIKKSQLTLFSQGIPQPKRAVRALIEVGLWQDQGETWLVPSYLKRNPSKKEIETKSEIAKESGEYGAHERWHVQEGRKSSKCRYCIAERIGNPIDPPNGVGWPTTEPETTTEPEPEPEPNNSSSYKVHQEPVDKSPTRKIEQIESAICDARASRRNDIANPTAWRRTTLKSIQTEHRPRIVELLERFPDAPVTVISAAVDSGDTRNLAYYAPRQQEEA
jgi:hypothetical protein